MENIIPHECCLVNHARMLTAYFGSTYMCEQLFRKMNFAKCKTRTQLSDAHVEGTLRLASSQLQWDIQHIIGHSVVRIYYIPHNRLHTASLSISELQC